jgi:hypothetical protein
MPVIGFINGGSADASARFVAAFRKGLSETGSAEGQNAAVEYHWLEGQYAASALPGVAISATRRRTRSATSAGRRTLMAWYHYVYAPRTGRDDWDVVVKPANTTRTCAGSSRRGEI